MTLQDFLRAHGIRFFSARELTLQARDGVVSQPPQSLWNNILPTVRMADEIRTRFGGPVGVTSGYRTAEYNRRVGGSPTSRHMTFHALDLNPGRGDYFRFFLVVTDVVREWQARGHVIGIGIYPKNRFIHVDVDAGRPTSVVWTE
jgi:uncharacterized protein YcbK (DUF882 family)